MAAIGLLPAALSHGIGSERIGCDGTVPAPALSKVARRRRKRRSAKLILWAIVIFVAAGFLARRILAPSAIYYLTHRPPQHSSDLSVDKAVPPIDESQARPAPPAVSRRACRSRLLPPHPRRARKLPQRPKRT